MAASNVSTSFFSAFMKFFSIGSEGHACIHPKYLLLQGLFPPIHTHHCCLNHSITILHPRQLNQSLDSDEKDPEKMACFQILNPAVRPPKSHVDLNAFQHTTIEEVRAALAALQSQSPIVSITLSDDSSRQSQLDFLNPRKLPSLRGLQLSSSALKTTDLGQKIKSAGIVHLDVSSSNIDDDQLIALIEKNPHLESLDISDCPITDRGFSAISALTRLKILNAKNLLKTTSASFTAIPTGCLEYIALGMLRGADHCVPFNDVLCHHLASARQLQYLDLSGVPEEGAGITDIGIASITNHLRQLGFLSLQNCFLGTSQGLMGLNRLTNLTYLDLLSDNENHIVDEAAIAMLGGMPALKTLKLTGNIKAAEGNMFKGYSKTGLECLWIDCNDSGINAGVQYLPKTIQELRLSAMEIETPIDPLLCKKIAEFPRLRSLFLINYFLPGALLKEHWLRKLEGLEELVIAGSDFEGFNIISQSAKKLQTLELGNIETCDDDLEPILNFKDLRHLFGLELSSRFAQKLASTGHWIESLQVGVYESSTLQSISAFAKTLKYLRIAYHPETDANVEHLAQLVNLETLLLDVNFSPEEYNAFLPALQKLHFLMIADQRGVFFDDHTEASVGVDRSVMETISKLPALKTLWVMNFRPREEDLKDIKWGPKLTSRIIEPPKSGVNVLGAN